VHTRVADTKYVLIDLPDRYGLKHLIIENASAIMKAVEKYSASDNDVAVFGKILQNHIDEEFVLVQDQLKTAVTDLLRVHIKGKDPMKGDDVMSNRLQAKLTVSSKVEENSYSLMVSCSKGCGCSVGLARRGRMDGYRAVYV
jgi:hypothetical protein